MKSIKKAFSIIELLVVVVIIGILATLIVGSWGFVSRNAVNTTIQNDLSNATEQLEVFNYQNKKYPTTINCAVANSTTNLCIRTASNSTFSYKIDSTNSNYCYSVTNSNTSYYITNNTTKTPTFGSCVEQSGLVFNYDFANLGSYSGSGITVTDISGKSKNSTLSSSLVTYLTENYGGVNLNGNHSGASRITPTTGALIVNSISNNAGVARTVEIIYKLFNPSNGFGPLFGMPPNGNWDERIFPSTNTITFKDTAVPQNTIYLNANIPNSTTNTNIQAITYSYNGTNNVKVYRNGVYQNQATLSTILNTGLWDYNFGYQCSGSLCSSVYMNLYVVRYYSVELTAQQITDNFNALKSRYGL